MVWGRQAMPGACDHGLSPSASGPRHPAAGLLRWGSVATPVVAAASSRPRHVTACGDAGRYAVTAACGDAGRNAVTAACGDAGRNAVTAACGDAGRYAVTAACGDAGRDTVTAARGRAGRDTVLPGYRSTRPPYARGPPPDLRRFCHMFPGKACTALAPSAVLC